MKRLLLGAFITLITSSAFASSDLTVQNKDGLVELDCLRPVPAKPLVDVSISCDIYNSHLITQDTPKGKKEGLMDKHGQILLMPIYDNILWLNERLIQVKQNDKYALVDAKTGKALTPLHFDAIDTIKEGYIGVRQGNMSGYLDETGRVVIPLKYGSTYGFSHGLAQIFNHGTLSDNTLKEGLIDKSGKEIFAPIYQSIFVYPDSQRIVFKTDNNLEGISDLSGNTIIEPSYPYIGGFVDDYASFALLSNDLYGYLDKDGQEIIAPQYQRALPPYKTKEGMLFVVAKRQGTNTRWGAVNQHNQTVIDFIYKRLIPSPNTLIATDITSKVHLLNEQGHRISTQGYDSIDILNQDIGIYTQSKKYGLISTKGQALTAPIYDWFYTQSNANNELIGFSTLQAGKQGFINTAGKTLLPAIYDEVNYSHNDRLYLKKDGLYGVADLSGKVLSAPIYDDIKALAQGYSKAKLADGWYLLDPQGKNLGKTSAPD